MKFLITKSQAKLIEGSLTRFKDYKEKTKALSIKLKLFIQGKYGTMRLKEDEREIVTAALLRRYNG